MTRRHLIAGAGAAAALPLAGLAGCSRGAPAPVSGGKPLTPAEFALLSDEEKHRYRSVVIRIPEAWGGSLMPFFKGPWPTVREKAVASGELNALMADYSRALFEKAHPRVKVEFANFDMWSDNFRSTLAVSLSARRAPSVYVARDLPQTIEQGLYADITDLVQAWDQKDRIPDTILREGTVAGRHYTIAADELSGLVIRYRKDWFREAGIFNEFGEPGPRTDWTWDDFRAIAKKLSDPAKKRWGYAGSTNDFLFNGTHGVRTYVPDPSGKRTWRFPAEDPLLLESIARARELVQKDKSINTSVSMGWFEYHSEFDAGRAAMITSWAAHLPKESLATPDKFSKTVLYRDMVGMVPPPRGPLGLHGLIPTANALGFDPTLSKEQLAATFEWMKWLFYGPIFANRLRTAMHEAKYVPKEGKPTPPTVYGDLFCNPYQPEEKIVDDPPEKYFPPDYIRTYDAIRQTSAAPMPREFGLQEPPTADLEGAVNRMYSEAVTTGDTPQAIAGRAAKIIDQNLLNFRNEGDRDKQARWIEALDRHYQTRFPRYAAEDWPEVRQRLFQLG